MKIGIVTVDPNEYNVRQLRAALERKKISSICFPLDQVTIRVGIPPQLCYKDVDISKDLIALIVRGPPLGSLEQVVIRFDILHRLKRFGMKIFNDPRAMEISGDKFLSMALLAEAGIPVPKTIVTESVKEALKAFDKIGDVVVKPIFGSRGRGIIRITDPETAYRVFNALYRTNQVIYFQEFIEHGNQDIRAFVIGEEVVSAMYRVSKDWKSNISMGAIPKPCELGKELNETCVKAAKCLGLEIAGIDLIESSGKIYIVEVNPSPGWQGLQSVSKVNIADCIVSYVIQKFNEN